MSSVPARCCGWLATMPTVRPSSRPSAGDDVRRVRGAQLEAAVLVEHVVDDVRARRTTRSRRAGTADAARAQSRSTGSSHAHDAAGRRGGSTAGTRGASTSDLGVVLVVGTTSVGDAAAAVVHAGAAERAVVDVDPGERAARCRGRSRRRTRPRSSPRRRRARAAAPGPHTHGPDDDEHVGTTPDASASALATRPHACSDGTPSATSAPELTRSCPTTGMPKSIGVADGPLDGLALGRCRSRRRACRPRGGTC